MVTGRNHRDVVWDNHEVHTMISLKSKVKRYYSKEKGIHTPPCTDCSFAAKCAAEGICCKGYRYYTGTEESAYRLDVAKSLVGLQFKST